MSTTSLDKELQERLREASAIGDIDEVKTLVDSGVNINSQNEINGWTCLHWACKRNHKQIVAYLLDHGADKEILTAKEELAVQLTSKPEIKRLLGVEVEEEPEVKEPELPIIPNYLSNPPFLYSNMDKDNLIIAQQHASQNGSSAPSEDLDSEPATLSPTHEPQQQQQPQTSNQNQNLFSENPIQRDRPYVPVLEQNGSLPTPAINGTLPMELSADSHHGNHSGHARQQNGPVCPALPSPGGGGSSHGSTVTNPTVTRQQSIPQQLNCPQPSQSGTMPAFQPFFFTSTFPVNVQELVLKVRIQNPNARENDFIEVELDRQELTYRALLRVCCRELDISAEHVEKIRKLPNTMLRKDKDVARLQDFQELEVVLEKAEGLSFLSSGSQGGLADRPCYNLKASRLTY
ncbi:ankyrin repeat domain-containing protein 40 [Chanos chanos]|uniref:Ankyrin repeat domain-containing protein 40 n=1 Tax=Chanos chanos TaxID=29144 RepID=A0A6J2WRY2_CHACN|nr:ankyrin repeat domain-containing protein 40 [Chanos chanos]